MFVKAALWSYAGAGQIHCMRAGHITDRYWTPDILSETKKLKISYISDAWGLNLVTAKQRYVFEALGIPVPS